MCLSDLLSKWRISSPTVGRGLAPATQQNVRFPYREMWKGIPMCKSRPVFEKHGTVPAAGASPRPTLASTNPQKHIHAE